MKALESETVLRNRLGGSLDRLTARKGIAAMCSFYADERADGAAIGSDRDMLLYQWGVDTFSAPETFRVSITRQLNVVGESQPYQLALIFSFQPTDLLRKIDSGNQWCRSPADLPAFQRFVDASEAFKSAADAKADHVELQFNRRG
jgi:hypothetical protein